MANHVQYRDLNLAVGDTLSVAYKIKEGEKERQQVFKGVLIKIKGADEANRMITVRKISKTGIGIERIMPLASANIATIKVDKKGNFSKAKLYFIRRLSDAETRRKLYSHKKTKK